MEIHNKMATADMVLTCVKSILSAVENNDSHHITLEAYANCREQGYSLINWKGLNNSKRVSFSEYRNSDNIVVYCGLHQDFTSGNIPNREVWERSEEFNYDEPYMAAQYIVGFLMSEG